MKFLKPLIKGKFIKRYKRFFADIKIGKEIVTAHCPNTGSMKGLLDEGNEVFISKNDDCFCQLNQEYLLPYLDKNCLYGKYLFIESL